MAARAWTVIAVVLLVGCGSAGMRDTARRQDARTSVTATQKAGLPSRMTEADPDDLERRYGVEAARAWREERARAAAERRARAEVVDDKPKPTPP